MLYSKTTFLIAILLLIISSVPTVVIAKMFDPTSRVLDSGINFNNKQAWTDLAKDEDEAIAALLSLLKRSRTGKTIVEIAERKAMNQGVDLQQLLHGGTGSICDTTLVRRFSKTHPEEITYETKSKVYINRSLSVIDAVLDIAHELTHYNFRATFNPYRSSFNLITFIHSTIEGSGGEVDAYLAECQVFKELFPKGEHVGGNCSMITDERSGQLSRALTIKYFYQIGKDKDDFENELTQNGVTKEEFPLISANNPVFISSDYGTSYPVASLREYNSILERVCQNDNKRISLLNAKNETTRSPASINSKCQKFISNN